MMITMEKVRCFHCANERGIGFDAWCDVRPKNHNISQETVCDCFTSIKSKKNNNENKYTDIEVNEAGMIILWNGSKGEKFTFSEFLDFLNEKVIGD